MAAFWVFVFHVAVPLGVTVAGTAGIVKYVTLHVAPTPMPAVVVFFVVSGFVLYRPFALARFEGRPADSFGGYALRRAARIVPGYWVALVITALVLGRGYVFTPVGLVRYFGFTQVYSWGSFGRGLAPAWTLDVDVAFYLFLPFAVTFIRRRPFTTRRQFLDSELGMCAALYVASTIWQVAMLRSGLSARQVVVLGLSFPGALDMLAIGMALAAASVAYAQTPDGPIRDALGRYPWAVWLLAIGAYWLTGTLPELIGSGHLELSWMAVKEARNAMVLLLVAPLIFGLGRGGRLRKVLGSPIPVYLNTICFGFYLWHGPVIDGLVRLHARRSLGAVPFVALALAGSVALGSASWYAIERPAQRWARRRISRPDPQAVATPGVDVTPPGPSVLVEAPPKRVRALDRRARRVGALGERPVGGDDPHRVHAGVAAQAADDLVVAGVRLRLRCVGDLDHRRADRGRRLSLEHDGHVLALRGRPPLELIDELQHRRVAVTPPLVRARADHVHSVDEPAHGGQANQSSGEGGRRPCLRSALRRFTSRRRCTDARVGRVRVRAVGTRTARSRRSCRRTRASSRLRACERVS